MANLNISVSISNKYIFFAIIRNILIREDALVLNFDFIEQVYRIHQMANKRGKKTRERKGKKSQKSDK